LWGQTFATTSYYFICVPFARKKNLMFMSTSISKISNRLTRQV